jgi:hypothetical protein
MRFGIRTVFPSTIACTDEDRRQLLSTNGVNVLATPCAIVWQEGGNAARAAFIKGATFEEGITLILGA